MELFLGIAAAIALLLIIILAITLKALIRVLLKQNSIVEANVHLGLKQIKAFEGTTTLPPNMASANCQHHWIIIKDEKLANSVEQKLITILQCEMCGSLDKTIEHIAPITPVVPKSECRHVWEKQKSVVLESPYEQLAENNPHGFVPPPGSSNQPWFFRKTYVSQRICPKCGAIDTIQASNIEMTTE